MPIVKLFISYFLVTSSSSSCSSGFCFCDGDITGLLMIVVVALVVGFVFFVLDVGYLVVVVVVLVFGIGIGIEVEVVVRVLLPLGVASIEDLQYVCNAPLATCCCGLSLNTKWQMQNEFRVSLTFFLIDRAGFRLIDAANR